MRALLGGGHAPAACFLGPALRPNTLGRHFKIRQNGKPDLLLLLSQKLREEADQIAFVLHPLSSKDKFQSVGPNRVSNCSLLPFPSAPPNIDVPFDSHSSYIVLAYV